ncbi:MAG: hypothetical protein ACYDCQ_15890 [Dehalococcoidia bacterium]
MVATASRPAGKTAQAYARLEERVIARDQVGAGEVFYGLVQEGRPPLELLGEFVRIHAPYTQVPYHQRLDDGLVKFVNNDHCLLSARAGLRLADLLDEQLRYLPLAQTIWYIPTGLDIWNQLLGNAPGHYTRLYKIEVDRQPPPPRVYWEDQQPAYLDEATHREKLNQWLTLVQRGEVVQSYRVFLGLLEDAEHRDATLAQLVFAGLIDVQDRMLFNRSYTTGHKSYRARATVELGDALGWENAHSVVYAGVPDIAVGPRWYSTYEMACNVTQAAFEGRDHELLHNDAPLNRSETKATVELLLRGAEPAFISQITALLRAGKGPRQIIDVIQLAAAEVILWTHEANAFSMPQHAYEYCNTVRWFFDRFDHPHQVKLLYVAAGFVNAAAQHQLNTGHGPAPIRRPRGSEALSQPALLRRLEDAILALRPDESVALVAAYLLSSYDRGPLVHALLTTATQIGNDPHNQELGLCLVEDYLHSTATGRERLLLAAAMHNAGHRKYGDPLEAYRRFADALGIEAHGAMRGDGAPAEALLDE